MGAATYAMIAAGRLATNADTWPKRRLRPVSRVRSEGKVSVDGRLKTLESRSPVIRAETMRMELGDIRVYHGGSFVAYRDAKVGLLTHGLNYGTGCFEGIRGYWNADHGELYLFKLAEHFQRLQQSAKLLMMELPDDVAGMCQATVELMRLNDFRQDVYVRPIAFKAAEEIGEESRREVAAREFERR